MSRSAVSPSRLHLAVRSERLQPAVRPEDVVSIALTGQPVPRRLTREQGWALEILGHAVEYLIDSRLFRGETRDSEAISMLKGANRSIFQDSVVGAPIGMRVRRWLGL
jgi:hypothetical protein